MTSVHPYAAARPQPPLAAGPASAPSRSPALLSAPLPPTPSIASSSGAASPLLGASLSPSLRPPFDRTASSASAFSDTPVATNSALNKAASASSSIYQRCNAVRQRLLRVPDFRERFFDSTESTLQGALSPSVGGPSNGAGSSAASAGADPNSGGAAGGAGPQTDPVSQVLSVLRLGASLCFLFNQLGHAHQLDVNPQATLSNLKACQRGAAHFIMACKQDLRWPEGDLFAVNELYGQDTNGVVKVRPPFSSSLSPAALRSRADSRCPLQVVHTVTKLLDVLEAQGALLPPPDLPDPIPQAGPSDERSLVVREILDSERKYMQDLEVLQVRLRARPPRFRSGALDADSSSSPFAPTRAGLPATAADARRPHAGPDPQPLHQPQQARRLSAPFPHRRRGQRELGARAAAVRQPLLADGASSLSL